MKASRRRQLKISCFICFLSCIGVVVYKQIAETDSKPQALLPVISDQSSPNALEKTSTNSSAVYMSSFGALPDTLQDTTVMGRLAVDDNGHLIISSDIRQIFDYFLSAIEEEPIEIILGRINEYLTNSLTEPALSEARAILNSYIDLKLALYRLKLERSPSLQTLAADGSGFDKTLYLSLLGAQFADIDRLKSIYLTREVREAFYGKEERYDQYTFAKMNVLNDGSLSDQEKQYQLEQIDASAPQEMIEARREVQIIDELHRRTADLKRAGADESEIRSLKIEMFGYEAAERFEQLEKDRAVWQSRIDQYLIQRNHILSAEGLSQEDQQEQIETLKDSLFEAREQLRVEVYERQKTDA
ncbi:lipase secretion chaperone [Salinisphaera sp. G21_0]|uniref:lipase secretion chaperone n=1 Tax=Salinisphaera sp. G21_0 TaxID=2821094 RepID=UPI001AD9EF25|nr:lipase secretion chaperone [Salinisphaera sp. G21_0]MBO9483854.1 hypothetical protein [Salinisphaera sp. G21_0]